MLEILDHQCQEVLLLETTTRGRMLQYLKQVDPWGLYKRECVSFVAYRLEYSEWIYNSLCIW